MANTKIPLKDKVIIKKRLAQGMSYRRAMQGTAVKSTQTVKRFLEEAPNEIKQIREDYLELIESFGASDYDLALQLAKMVKAKRPFGNDHKLYPDWKTQLEAIKYIGQLKGINSCENEIRVNILNNVAFLARYTHE